VGVVFMLAAFCFIYQKIKLKRSKKMINGIFKADEFSATYEGKTVKGKIADLNLAQFEVFADDNKTNITMFNDIKRVEQMKFENNTVNHSYEGNFYPGAENAIKMDGKNIIQIKPSGEPMNIKYTLTFDDEKQIITYTDSQPASTYAAGVGVVKVPREIVIVCVKI
jgi:hypothetical protein